jgi:hypothetical protein
LPEVFGQGGFDVVIGNPPYVRTTELKNDEKKFYENKYPSAYKQYDIYVLFYEKAINLLREGGFLGFITSNKFLASEYGLKLRELILKETKMVEIIDYSNAKVFGDASTYPVVLILEKTKFSKNHKIKYINNETKETSECLQSDVNPKNGFIFYNKTNSKIISRLESKSFQIKEFFKCKRGLPLNKVNFIDKGLKIVVSKDVDKYTFTSNEKTVKDCLNQDLNQEKIILPRTVLNIKAAYIDEPLVIMDRIYYLFSDNKVEYSLKYVLAILNSTLLDWYYKKKYGTTHIGGGYLDLKGEQILTLPIYKIDFSNKKEKSKHDELVKLANKMLKFNKDLQKLDPIMDDKECEGIKKEIEKTDREIDKKVYELHGL